MKKLLLIPIVLGCYLLVNGQTPSMEYKAFVKKADSLYLAMDYKNAALAYSSAFKSFGWKGAVNDRYNAARAWALSKNPDSAFFNLQRLATKAYFGDYDKVTKDEALRSLHADKRWQPLLDQIKYNHLPDSWFRAGNKPTSYEMQVDNTGGEKDKTIFIIKSGADTIYGFGTLMKGSPPGDYLGKRIRMTGNMKSKDVTDWAGFWLRVDGPDNTQLAFDNMYNRSIKGTTEWNTYEIVLDVLPASKNIAFGALLSGNGQIWFESPTFEIVGNDVPTTSDNNNR